MAGNHCWIKLLWCVASKHKKYQIDSRLKYFSSPLIGLMPCKNVPESFEETSSVQKKGPFAVRSQKGEKGRNSSHFSKVNKLLNCRWIANKKYNFSPLTMELFFPWVFNSFVGNPLPTSILSSIFCYSSKKERGLDCVLLNMKPVTSCHNCCYRCYTVQISLQQHIIVIRNISTLLFRDIYDIYSFTY